jgi:hypothetical protein
VPLPKVGERSIVHCGYGFFAELEWTEKGWHTVRSDGPFLDAGFTTQEKETARASSELPKTETQIDNERHAPPSVVDALTEEYRDTFKALAAGPCTGCDWEGCEGSPSSSTPKEPQR